MSDKAYNETERRLKALELKIQREYATATREIQAKYDAYMKQYKSKLDKAKREWDLAKKSGDAKREKAAKEEYQRILRNVTYESSRYNSMINQFTDRLAKANEIALKYVNDALPEIFAINLEQLASDLPPEIFDLLDEETIKEMFSMENIKLPPPKDFDAIKDKLWNKKALNSQVLQGIIQGETVSELSKRLLSVTNMNIAAAIRNARTLFTSVQNEARQRSYERGQANGVILEKEWVSAHDGRTRDAHLELHGVRVPIDEAFENSLGSIRFPADPYAAPANVYNCRCAIRSHYIGFKKKR